MTETTQGTLSVNEVAKLRHELRTPVNQIVGYCEMLLEDAQSPQDGRRRESLSEALAAVRDAISFIEKALPADVATLDADRIVLLYESLHGPQARIIDAMSGLLREGQPDEKFIADVCRVRNAAERLLPTDRPRSEPTTALSAPAGVQCLSSTMSRRTEAFSSGGSSAKATRWFVRRVDRKRSISWRLIHSTSFCST